jgi:hypothetical protein
MPAAIYSLRIGALHLEVKFPASARSRVCLPADAFTVVLKEAYMW